MFHVAMFPGAGNTRGREPPIDVVVPNSVLQIIHTNLPVTRDEPGLRRDAAFIKDDNIQEISPRNCSTELTKQPAGSIHFRLAQGTVQTTPCTCAGATRSVSD